MTITTSYAPLVAPVNDDREYPFGFPFAEESDIYVYEIDADGGRQKVQAADYTVTKQSTALVGSSPLSQNGVVAFTRAHRAGTEQVQVHRNTFMDQTVDWGTFSPFKTVMIEFTLDKLTMILQEINERKCESAPTEPILQNQQFGDYYRVKPLDLNNALNKLTRIAFQIDQSATDCRPGSGNGPTGFDPNPYEGSNPGPAGDGSVVEPQYPLLEDIGALGAADDATYAAPGFIKFTMPNYSKAYVLITVSGSQNIRLRLTKNDGSLIFDREADTAKALLTTDETYAAGRSGVYYVPREQACFLVVTNRLGSAFTATVGRSLPIAWTL